MKSYDSLDEINDFLIPCGFKKYKPSPFDNESICANYQKRYDDDDGKKYFINAKVWDYTWTDRIPEQYVIEFQGQFYQAGTHNAVDFEFIDWKLDEVESWMSKLFSSGLIEHYEKWD